MAASFEAWGGSTEHGRACYYVEVEGISILLDCGINKDTGAMPEIDKTKLNKIDYIFLSHSHEDHSEALIRLIQQGVNIKTLMTIDTGRQLHQMYNGQLEEQSYEFLYFDEEVEPLKWKRLTKNLSFCYGSCGHMPGAVWFFIEICDKTIFYSGDYSDDSLVLSHHFPHALTETLQIDLGIIDCALGNDNHSYEHSLCSIYNDIGFVMQSGGKVILPCTPYSKIIEIIILMRSKYSELIFAFHEEIFTELMQVCRQDPRVASLFEEGLKNKVFNVYDALVELDYHVGFTQVLDEMTKDYTHYMTRFVEKNNNHILLLTRQSNGLKPYELELKEDKFNATIVGYNILAHQGTDGVNRILKNQDFNKVILCHSTKERLELAVNRLHKIGHRQVRVCDNREKLDI